MQAKPTQKPRTPIHSSLLRFAMGQLRVFFFPLMSHGHMIPLLDIAKLFAARGVTATIITTPLNASYFSKSIETSTLEIRLRTVRFPAAEVGLPENCERAEDLPSPAMFPLFLKATLMLQHPIEQILRESPPDCLIADAFFPWATAVAAKLNVPTIVLHTHGVFPLCAWASLEAHNPQLTVSSDDETFIVPHLPHEIKLSKSQLPPTRKQSDKEKFMEKMKESEAKCFGVLANSFYELEPDYADHYRNIMGMKAWLIGPVSLCNREIEDKAQRGGQQDNSIHQHQCLKWLDSRKPDSVIYVCFGTTLEFTNPQLAELAMGLEASGQNFIWVVRGRSNEEEWLPEGFEERTRDRGLVIRGWAPQVLILDHRATGGFMTHCGWNSTLEGVSAGLPLVTWPGFAEQFLNEKLVTEVLRTGVGVGANKWSRKIEGIGREAISDAIKKIMVGEEAEEMRRRAKVLKDRAKKAVEEGGSSYSDLNALLQELSSYRA